MKSELFRLITPLTYWILIILWSFILYFYIKKMWDSKTKQLFRALVVILAIDAFRTLFESVYFGLWYTSLSGLLPLRIGTFLTLPELVIIPKIINVIAALIVIVLLVKRWLPREEQEKERMGGVLGESEQRYRSLFERSNDAIFLVDTTTGQYLDANVAAERLTGRPLSELTTLTTHEITPAGASKRLRQASSVEDTIECGETTYVRPDGSTRTALLSIVPLSRTLSFGIAHDITDRKKAEEERLKSEHDLLLSQRIAQLGSWRLDLETNEVFWTEELYNMYGFDPALPPPPYTEHMKLFTSESWELLSTSLANTRDTGIPYELELEMVKKDGSKGWMWVRGETVVDKHGKTTELWGAAQDITDRKHAELALKESEERFRALHNASFGGITIHDKGQILECNNGLSEITGYEYSELIGMNGLYLISNDTRDQVIQNINTGYDKPYEVKGVRKNGEIYPVRLEARKIPYKGKVVRVVEFRDITERKQIEKEKEDLEVQLRQAQKMEAVGRLAGGVAHDFNNMLSVIIGNTELAMEVMDRSNPLYADLEEIRNAGERSAALTRQLLAFARKQTVAPKVLDLNTTVADMNSMIQRLMGEDIELAWIPGQKVWPVKMDPSQIDQILANLCVNARDSIMDVGKVTIETDSIVFDEIYCASHAGFVPGEYALLAVSDNGCGMDADTLANVFEPFFTTKKQGEGTGLGLATVYGIVKQNNGFVNVYSEPDQGTTCRIYLPRYLDRKAPLPKTGEDRLVEHGHETILLVEDELSILKLTTRMLERLGYTVVAANTPGEAISLAHEYAGEIHLLMTDVVMPEMNGRDLVKNILSSYPALRRLFMSGYTANVIAHHGVLEKGVNFIQKPFSRNSLAAKVREVLDASEE